MLVGMAGVTGIDKRLESFAAGVPPLPNAPPWPGFDATILTKVCIAHRASGGRALQVAELRGICRPMQLSRLQQC